MRAVPALDHETFDGELLEEDRGGEDHELDKIGYRHSPEAAHEGIQQDNNADSHDAVFNSRARADRNKYACADKFDAIINDLYRHPLPGEQLAQQRAVPGFQVLNRTVNSRAPPADGEDLHAENSRGYGHRIAAWEGRRLPFC